MFGWLFFIAVAGTTPAMAVTADPNPPVVVWAEQALPARQEERPEVSVRITPRFFTAGPGRRTVRLSVNVVNPGEKFYCPGIRVQWDAEDDAGMDTSGQESDCQPYHSKPTLFRWERVHMYHAPGGHNIRIAIFKGKLDLYVKTVHVGQAGEEDGDNWLSAESR